MTRKFLAYFLTCSLAFLLLLTATVFGHKLENLEAAMYHDAVRECIDGIFGAGFYDRYNQTIDMLNNFFDNLPSDTAGNIVYPGFFGGVYINDFGEAVFLIVDPESPSNPYYPIQIEDYTQAFTQWLPNNANYRFVENSYNTLNQELQRLRAIMHQRVDQGVVYSLNVAGVGIGQLESRIIVELLQYDNAMKSGFREYIMDSDLISFAQGAARVTLGGNPSQYFARAIVIWLAIIVIISIITIIAIQRIKRKRL